MKALLVSCGPGLKWVTADVLADCDAVAITNNALVHCLPLIERNQTVWWFFQDLEVYRDVMGACGQAVVEADIGIACPARCMKEVEEKQFARLGYIDCLAAHYDYDVWCAYTSVIAMLSMAQWGYDDLLLAGYDLHGGQYGDGRDGAVDLLQRVSCEVTGRQVSRWQREAAHMLLAMRAILRRQHGVIERIAENGEVLGTEKASKYFEILTEQRTL